VSILGRVRLEAGDVLAVALPPGPEWRAVVEETWEAGVVLLPLDHRLPRAQAEALARRARPTVVLAPDGARRGGGLPAEPDVALIVHTSGTGGLPKLARFTRSAIHAAVTSSALALRAAAGDPWLCCLPPAHVGGLLVLLRSVLLGSPVEVHPAFDPAAVAAERDVAFTSLVPTMLLRLLDANADLSSYRALLVGGAHLWPELRERAELAGMRVIETYGLTESCGGVVYDGMPLPGTEVRIDADGGILLRGPTTMLGYHLDPEATAEAFTADGWLVTNDAGELDHHGRLRVVGRTDDLINSGGEKVWPQEVETVLRRHPAVLEVAVAGRPDPEWGQRVVAWVVPSDPSDPPSLDDLRRLADAELSRHKAPRELVLVDELPDTFSGKVRRAWLSRE
jgi:O-succinylbenzoic acid--CoA ligase